MEGRIFRHAISVISTKPKAHGEIRCFLWTDLSTSLRSAQDDILFLVVISTDRRERRNPFFLSGSPVLNYSPNVCARLQKTYMSRRAVAPSTAAARCNMLRMTDRPFGKTASPSEGAQQPWGSVSKKGVRIATSRMLPAMTAKRKNPCAGRSVVYNM